MEKSLDEARAQLAIQIHLAEFVALRQELLELIKWRERLVFLSLGISGALFSFALSGQQQSGNQISRQLALYIVAPLASAVGGLWMVNTLRIHRIGGYIRDVLRQKLGAVLTAFPVPGGSQAWLEVFEWELSSQRLQFKWLRRFLEWLVLVSAFIFAGTVAQLSILSLQSGTLGHRLISVQMPALYYLNWTIISATLMLFLYHLMAARGQSALSSLERAVRP